MTSEMFSSVFAIRQTEPASQNPSSATADIANSMRKQLTVKNK